MPSLTIDEQIINAPSGATLLEAAALLGVEIPTLCHLPGKRPHTSCMICVVAETRTGKLLPACAVPAESGMMVETDNAAIRAARQTVLELLLSEHAGDCEAPCARICPAGLDIPTMLRCIGRGDMEQAARLSGEALAIPAILGFVCHAPCETGCRRARHDAAVAIRHLHRVAGEWRLSCGTVERPVPADLGKRIAIVGAGPAGLTAAWALRRLGYECQMHEREHAIGGKLLRFPEQDLPAAVRDAELHMLLQDSGIDTRLASNIRPGDSLRKLVDDFDAVIVTCDHLPSDARNVIHALPRGQVVREAQSGRKAAEAARRLISGVSCPSAPYDANLGAIAREAIPLYARGRISAEAFNRPCLPEHPRQEAERCLRCDCHAPLSCKLRQYATKYEARPHPFKSAERAPISVVQRHAGVLFEPGKCVKCGLCVDITREHHETLGLTFIGRGFSMKVGVPFGGGLDAALSRCAEACVRACPTGALVFSEQEERLA